MPERRFLVRAATPEQGTHDAMANTEATISALTPAPVFSTLRARRLYRRILFGVAPATVATAVVALREHDLAVAVLVFATMAVVTNGLDMQRHPLHLVPFARAVVAIVISLAGVLFAYLLGLIFDLGLRPIDAIAAGICTSLISLLSTWLEDRFLTDRPMRMAVVGSGHFAQRLAAELRENRIESYLVVGHIADEEDVPGATWLGPVGDIREVVLKNSVDLLVIGPGTQRLQVFEQAARACLDLPVRMIEATALYEDVLGHVPIGSINSAWFQFIMHPRYSPSSPLTKRGLDVVVSATLLLVFSPLLLLCALAVKLADGGPILYRQSRIGEEGRTFDMMKFRTLVPDADAGFAAGRSEDELITRPGRWLRKGHLNELPQLIQVLRGQISLVGPRPEPPALVESLSGLVPHYERRALVKPGLTGWAQVRCGYAGTHFGSAWKTCHDLYYIKHRSARFDVLILFQTLFALVEREEDEQTPAHDFILGEGVELTSR